MSATQLEPTMARKNTQSWLKDLGLERVSRVHPNLNAPRLIEEAVRRNEGQFAESGALVCRTGDRTGRSPEIKFFVKDETSEDIWWGDVNRPIEPEVFERVWSETCEYLEGREVFVQECYAGHDPDYHLPVRVINERAWHSLFVDNMFVTDDVPEDFAADLTVLHAPGCDAAQREEVLPDAYVLLDLSSRRIVIGGTEYAGEIKKSVFTVMNWLLPQEDVFPMHCSANVGKGGDSAVFFGLSGTGKTTLSADPDRALIGDDEHAWGSDTLFNIEGGCYAKTINLTPESEPEIWNAVNRFGAILENVCFDNETRRVDFDDSSITQNTRGSYPLEYIDNYSGSGVGDPPQDVVFLTADAFGVLPPISRLSSEQAIYYFLLGYTSKLAGTEVGVTEPEATFSACFGAPFMVHNPVRYAELLKKRVEEQDANVWLINTGWTGGPYGEGHRIDLPYTRRMLSAALDGEFDDIEFETEDAFGLSIPTGCPDIPDAVLSPRGTWEHSEKYDRKAERLIEQFRDEFDNYRDDVSDKVVEAGP